MQKKSKPEAVVLALYLIWASIALAAVIALIDKISGHASENRFMFNLVVCSLISILPYKLNQGSNPSRYFLGIFTAISVFMILGGVDAGMTKLEKFSGFLTTAMQAFAAFKLFSEPSNVWFKQS